MDFPNMKSECRGYREAFGITGYNTAPVKVFSRGSADRWRFEDTWCDSKLDVPVKGPQWSQFFTDSSLYLSMSALFC